MLLGADRSAQPSVVQSPRSRNASDGSCRSGTAGTSPARRSGACSAIGESRVSQILGAIRIQLRDELDSYDTAALAA